MKRSVSIYHRSQTCGNSPGEIGHLPRKIIPQKREIFSGRFLANLFFGEKNVEFLFLLTMINQFHPKRTLPPILLPPS